MGFQKGNKLSGSRKGRPNKFPRDLKEKVLAAIAALEADGKSLTEEALKDPRWFWENFVKPMLPKHVDQTIHSTIDIELFKGFSIEQLIEIAKSGINSSDDTSGEE